MVNPALLALYSMTNSIIYSENTLYYISVAKIAGRPLVFTCSTLASQN